MAHFYFFVVLYPFFGVFFFGGFLLGRASLEYTMASNALDLTGHGPEHCNNVMRHLGQKLEQWNILQDVPRMTPVKPVLWNNSIYIGVK